MGSVMCFSQRKQWKKADVQRTLFSVFRQSYILSCKNSEAHSCINQKSLKWYAGPSISINILKLELLFIVFHLEKGYLHLVQ